MHGFITLSDATSYDKYHINNLKNLNMMFHKVINFTAEIWYKLLKEIFKHVSWALIVAKVVQPFKVISLILSQGK